MWESSFQTWLTTTYPLRCLTRKNTHKKISFEWGSSQSGAFESTKNSMSKDLILGYYDVNDEIQLITDNSPVELGAVLMQTGKNFPRIISFASKGYRIWKGVMRRRRKKPWLWCG